MKQFLRILALLILSVPCLCETAGAQAIDYSVHANIIFRLTKYIEWNTDQKAGDFVIGVIGDSPVYDELKTVTMKKTVNNHRIVIQKFSLSESLLGCRILFIGEDESGSLKKIINAEPSSPILILTEDHGMCLKGSCINFIIEHERLKLEINKKNIEKRKMHIATELLELATLIE